LMTPEFSSFFTRSSVGAGDNPISCASCAFVMFEFACKISKIFRSVGSSLCFIKRKDKFKVNAIVKLK
jgi:hypothetical protein